MQVILLNLGADETDCTGGATCSEKYTVAVTGDAGENNK